MTQDEFKALTPGAIVYDVQHGQYYQVCGGRRLAADGGHFYPVTRRDVINDDGLVRWRLERRTDGR